MQIYPYINRPKIKPKPWGSFNQIRKAVRDWCENKLCAPIPAVAFPFWEGAGQKAYSYGSANNTATFASTGVSWVPTGINLSNSTQNITFDDLKILENDYFSIFISSRFHYVSNSDTFNGLYAGLDGDYIKIYRAGWDTHWRIVEYNDYAGVIFYSNGVITTGLLNNILYTRAGITEHNLYFDGELDTQDTTSVATETSIRRDLKWQGGNNNTLDLEILSIWNETPLNADQAALLNEQPYAMFEKKSFPTYFFIDSEAPSSTTIPVFIHHQNQMRA